MSNNEIVILIVVIALVIAAICFMLFSFVILKIMSKNYSEMLNANLVLTAALTDDKRRQEFIEKQLENLEEINDDLNQEIYAEQNAKINAESNNLVDLKELISLEEEEPNQDSRPLPE